jgi:hypothetical protein
MDAIMSAQNWERCPASPSPCSSSCLSSHPWGVTLSFHPAQTEREKRFERDERDERDERERERIEIED